MTGESRMYQLVESLFLALVAKVLVELVIGPWLKKEQQTTGLPPSAGGCRC